MKISVVLLAAASVLAFSGCREKKVEDTVKVGILHSMTGTMAISECPVMDSELLAVNEINESGGVLGKKIEVVLEDGESDAQKFAEKARKLLAEDGVATVFGCWTSSARKAVKPVFEEMYGLLWYPLQYEGMEASPNIMYMGAVPNQQIVPAVEYCASNFGKSMFLVGSDYVFPRTANAIIKAQLDSIEGKCVGEEYEELGGTDFSAVVEKIVESNPDVIMNTLNGDSNIAFFDALLKAGITAEKIPVMSFSISEEEFAKMDLKNLSGNLLSWSYYGSTKTPENDVFVRSYKATYGDDRKTSDPVEAGYIAVKMWAAACEKAGSFDVEAVRIASKGLSFQAPEGVVKLDGGNQHLCKYVRIGRIKGDGAVDEVQSTESPIRPDPYLSTYYWARGL